MIIFQMGSQEDEHSSNYICLSLHPRPSRQWINTRHDSALYPCFLLGFFEFWCWWMGVVLPWCRVFFWDYVVTIFLSFDCMIINFHVFNTWKPSVRANSTTGSWANGHLAGEVALQALNRIKSYLLWGDPLTIEEKERLKAYSCPIGSKNALDKVFLNPQAVKLW